MNEKEIKEKIEFAKKIADEFEEPYKTESFKIILSSLMKKGKISNDSSEDGDTDDEGFESSDKLEQKIGIPKSEIMNVIDFDGEKCTLVKVKGASMLAKLLSGSLIALTIFRIVNNYEWVTTVKLGKVMTDYGLKTNNMAVTLQTKANETYLRTKGTGKSLQYRITTEGLQKGIELIKELA